MHWERREGLGAPVLSQSPSCRKFIWLGWETHHCRGSVIEHSRVFGERGGGCITALSALRIETTRNYSRIACRPRVGFFTCKSPHPADTPEGRRLRCRRP